MNGGNGNDAEKALALQHLLAERLRQSQEAERAAVARAVHDSVGQTLSAMKMQLHEASRDPMLPPAAVACFRDLEGHVDSLLEDARSIASRLRPGVIDHFGLTRALEAALDRFGREQGLEARLQSSGAEPRRLPGNIEIGLLRIVELALANVAQHAGASRVDVVFEQTPDTVSVAVRDDGSGFDRSRLEPTRSLGLLDLESRAAALGGSLSIDSAPGAGTTVTARVPIAGAAPRAD
ncbi:MAG: histidine kinase [Pseudomonadota bacterium]